MKAYTMWSALVTSAWVALGVGCSDPGQRIGDLAPDVTGAADTAPAPDAGALFDTAQPPDTATLPDTAAVVDTGAPVDTAVAPEDAEVNDVDDVDDASAADADVADDAGTTIPISLMGCADGSREGYADLERYPAIAACGGAWTVPGLFAMAAACDREAGNDGTNAAGTGCSVTDLCAEGWTVCQGRAKVFQTAGGCAGALVGATGPVFFTTQMSSTGAFECATGATATNDLFGCGNLGCDFTGNATVAELCAPLTLSSHDNCKGLRNDLGCGDWCNHLGKYPGLPNAWNCGSDSTREALNVTKSHPEQQGGVLCCRQ